MNVLNLKIQLCEDLKDEQVSYELLLPIHDFFYLIPTKMLEHNYKKKYSEWGLEGWNNKDNK